jgi:hypothetical protein
VKGETVEDGEEEQITRGELASPAQATKWPARTLAGQPGETLRTTPNGSATRSPWLPDVKDTP